MTLEDRAEAVPELSRELVCRRFANNLRSCSKIQEKGSKKPESLTGLTGIYARFSSPPFCGRLTAKVQSTSVLLGFHLDCALAHAKVKASPVSSGL